MYISRHWKKYLLICLLIIVLISIDCRTRLEQNTQVLFCIHNAENARMINDDCVNQISKLEYDNAFFVTEELMQQEHFFRLIRNSYRSVVSGKSSVCFGIYIIALLAAISQQKCRQIHIHDIWYIRHRYDHIIYIQDTDGSKGITMQN